MWIATKKKNAAYYKTYQVIGWRSYYNLAALVVSRDIPDRFWFGQRPQLIKDLRGAEAEKIIVELQKVVQTYPYDQHYILWPGPNSNTFVAYVAREIPELKLSLPPTAIGKDFLGGTKFWSQVPSKSGYQMAVYGILGILLAKDEGLEINILSLVFGFNPKKHSLILPSIGDISLTKGVVL